MLFLRSYKFSQEHVYRNKSCILYIIIILKRPEWLGRVSMDHLLHTSQKINIFWLVRNK